MPTSPMVTSTPRLSEYAKSFVYPATIVRTVWPRVEAKGRELGLGFDWWQCQAGTVILGYRADGKYAATVGGVGMSIPRQVGKTYFVLALLVIMCILFPGLQVVWTAHHLRTSTKTFTTLRGICRRKKVAPHVRALRAGNGEQQVEFTNGSMIMFGARSQGFGRGFDEIDILVGDEAQIMDLKALEDMVASTNQARHVHGALLFFMGTPPRPSDPSEAFTERRRAARAGESDDAVWLEIGAAPGSDPGDRAQWPLMNPSFPLRTPEESLLRLRKNLANEDSWNREGRGIWDEDGRRSIFPNWAALLDDSVNLEGRAVSVALDIPPDLAYVSIGLASARPGSQLVDVRVVYQRSDPVATLQRLLADTAAGQIAYPIRLVGRDAAARRSDFEAAGIEVEVLSAADKVAACASLAAAVSGKPADGEVPAQDPWLRHGGAKALADAVAGAKWSGSVEGRVFDRKHSGADVSPLYAIAGAVHGVPDVRDWASAVDSFN